ncbi:ISPpu14, transposase Orf1 [Pseudomonas syringae pv. maculicola]|uniref:Transposase component n=2 Tax=Pseudomonas syringae group genomosp. 3 TaxID=251701 RepID=A0A3M2XYR6_PSEYM|nr:Transposase component [Pseudomonas syringae pv. maculicola]RMM76204.1 ISPpu14, transposase Orf1 [Pseudomonas syringae pv. maculicola]
MGTSPSLLSGYFMRPQRRSYSKSLKVQFVQECAQPGASIASVALSHSLNANLVHKWIRLQSQRTAILQVMQPVARPRISSTQQPSTELAILPAKVITRTLSFH